MGKSLEQKMVQRTSLVESDDIDVITLQHNAHATVVRTSVLNFLGRSLPFAIPGLIWVPIWDAFMLDGFGQYGFGAVIAMATVWGAIGAPKDYKNNMEKYLQRIFGENASTHAISSKGSKNVLSFLKKSRVELSQFYVNVDESLIETTKEGYLIPSTMAVGESEMPSHKVTNYLVNHKGGKVIEQVIEPTALYLWDQMADAVLEMHNFSSAGILYVKEMDDAEVGKTVKYIELDEGMAEEHIAEGEALRAVYEEAYKQHYEKISKDRDRYGVRYSGWHHDYYDDRKKGTTTRNNPKDLSKELERIAEFKNINLQKMAF